MKTIRISEEVWNEIAKFGRFGETPDDVLRRVFEIAAPAPREPVSAPVRQSNGDNSRSRKPFLAGGFEFPHGTEFRMKFHGEYKYALVGDGALVLD